MLLTKSVTSFNLQQKAASEALGTAFLVAAVIGSGIMADALTADDALALLANTIATGAILVVLISIFGPVSGAHFNPAVSLVSRLRREVGNREFAVYAIAQIIGGLGGVAAANVMFGLGVIEFSTHERTGTAQWLSEGVASFGLLLVVLMGARTQKTALPWLIGLYIVSAYWFTASTSFANPAVALARSLTDSFAGIRPADVPYFALAEVAGALLALGLVSWLFKPETVHQ